MYNWPELEECPGPPLPSYQPHHPHEKELSKYKKSLLSVLLLKVATINGLYQMSFTTYCCFSDSSHSNTVNNACSCS